MTKLIEEFPDTILSDCHDEIVLDGNSDKIQEIIARWDNLLVEAIANCKENPE